MDPDTPSPLNVRLLEAFYQNHPDWRDHDWRTGGDPVDGRVRRSARMPEPQGDPILEAIASLTREIREFAYTNNKIAEMMMVLVEQGRTQTRVIRNELATERIRREAAEERLHRHGL